MPLKDTLLPGAAALFSIAGIVWAVIALLKARRTSLPRGASDQAGRWCKPASAAFILALCSALLALIGMCMAFSAGADIVADVFAAMGVVCGVALAWSGTRALHSLFDAQAIRSQEEAGWQELPVADQLDRRQ